MRCSSDWWQWREPPHERADTTVPVTPRQTPSWLADALRDIRAADAANRVPHGLLIHEAPGAGGDWLADWTAQFMLCTQRDAAPCGSCASCRRVMAGVHPDLLRMNLLEDSRQIRIEQVRELSAELALTSHQGGYKIGIISPADWLNRFAANALLKTLEEPAPRTLILLVATQPSRLPATVLSRCLRIRIPAPSRAQATAWLEEACGPGDWNAVLDIIGEAPMTAAQAVPAEVVQIGKQVRGALSDLMAGRADPVALAEDWSRAELPLRLRCIENWLTKLIRERLGAAPFLTDVRAVPYLPRAETVLNTRELFSLLDGARELGSALESPINRGLALESLLRGVMSLHRHDTASLTR